MMLNRDGKIRCVVPKHGDLTDAEVRKMIKALKKREAVK